MFLGANTTPASNRCSVRLETGTAYARGVELVVPALAVIVSPAAALLGIWLGLRHQRGRELREMRRIAYVDWLKAARSLAYLDQSQPPGGQAQLPNPKRKRLLNDQTVELQILASPDVIRAAGGFLAFIDRPELISEMVGPWKTPDDVVDAFDSATRDVRLAVVNAMRADLGVGPMPLSGT